MKAPFKTADSISGDKCFWLQCTHDWKGYCAFSAAQMYGTGYAEHSVKNFLQIIAILESPEEEISVP